MNARLLPVILITALACAPRGVAEPGSATGAGVSATTLGPRAPTRDERIEPRQRQAAAEDGQWLGQPHEDSLARFFEALRRVEAGAFDARAAILHLGDSHTAADLYTDHVRLALQERFGDRGHGWVYPGKVWRTYFPRHVKLESSKDWDSRRGILIGARKNAVGPFGLGGVVTTSAERGATIRVSPRAGDVTSPNLGRLEVFYLVEPGGGSFTVSIDDEIHMRLPTSEGERVGPERWTQILPDDPHDVVLEANGDGPVTLFGLSLERQVPGVVYDVLGINGARATDAADWDWERLGVRQLAWRDPDLIILAYGSNEVDDDPFHADAYYERLFDLLLTLRNAQARRPACLLIGPPDRAVRSKRDKEWRTPQVLHDIIRAQRSAAFDAGCAYFDTFRAMGGAGTIDAWAREDPQRAQQDRVHLTRAGYRWLARTLYGSLMHHFARSPRAASAQPGR
jgi:lysophospholipase L1-like esterase